MIPISIGKIFERDFKTYSVSYRTCLTRVYVTPLFSYYVFSRFMYFDVHMHKYVWKENSDFICISPLQIECRRSDSLGIRF